MSENSQCLFVCYSTTMGIKYGHMACCTTKYLFPQESFLPRCPDCFFRVPSYTCQPHAFIGKKKYSHAEEVWWAHWSLWKIKKQVGCDIHWIFVHGISLGTKKLCGAKVLSSAGILQHLWYTKASQTRQEINKLLPLGARWTPATSNPWMIFSQSMFSEQFRWSILPKSQPEEAQETVRNARNPWENWWFLYLSCFRSQF